MIERLFILLLAVPLSNVFVSYSVSAAPQDKERCVLPGDCLRHGYAGTSIGWGKCTSRSAWKERYMHATRDERKRMWEQRGKPMGEIIFDAYELTDAQRTSCDQIREQSIKEWRRGMGEQFEEARGLRARSIERIGERLRVGRDLRDGEDGAAEAWTKLTSAGEKLEDRRILERRQEIKREHPIDWSALADRIEDILPQEQAIRGRQRLADRFPLTISSRHGQEVAGDTSSADDGTTDVDRWEAYVRKFTARYQLTAGQANAAASILVDVRARDARLTRAMREEVALFQTNADEESARRRREVHQFEVDDLLDGFKMRLDSLLTTAQQQTSTTP